MKSGSLKSIGVAVEAMPPVAGNARPVLHEVLHALRRLHEGGGPTTIDLHAIPFGPGDEQVQLAVRAMMDRMLNGR